MKIGKEIFLKLIVCMCCLNSFAQKDSNDVSIGITTYPFAYNATFKEGTTATGISLFSNTNEKLSIQLGALFDFKRYVYYEQVTHLHGDTIIGLNLFLPLILHYRYNVNNNINYFLTAGIILGGKYYLDKNNKTQMNDPAASCEVS